MYRPRVHRSIVLIYWPESARSQWMARQFRMASRLGLCASRYRVYPWFVTLLRYNHRLFFARHSLPILYYRFFLCELILDAIKKFDGLPRPVDFRSSWIMQHWQFPLVFTYSRSLSLPLFFSLFVRFHFPCTQQKKTRFSYEVWPTKNRWDVEPDDCLRKRVYFLFFVFPIFGSQCSRKWP